MGVPKPINSKLKESARPLEEKQWVKNVRENEDREAFEKVFRAYYKPLYHFAFGYVGPESAEDVVQTVFLKIWDKKKCWDPPGTLKQYLFAAVRNESLNLLRRQQVEMDAEDTVTRIFEELKRSSYAEEGPEAEKLRKAIQQGISRLPPRCRQIFILHRRSGLTYSEISTVLGITFSTVSTQMGRALKYLQKHLSDFLPVLVIKLSGLIKFL